MKKLSYSALAFAMALLINNCSEEGKPASRLEKVLTEEKNAISSKTRGEKFEYLTKHLNVIRDGFLVVAEDKEFKSLLYSEIEKEFDGDHNVLLITLFERSPQLRSLLHSSKYIDNAEFDVSMQAFSNIRDSTEIINLLPQIFIPNYLQLKENDILGTRTPTIASFNGDESLEQIEGATLNEPWGVQKQVVDEKFLEQNEVWIISFNETYGPIEGIAQNDHEIGTSSDARIEAFPSCIATDPCPPYTAMPPYPAWKDVRMDKYKIKCLKESIFSGKADFNAVTYSAWPKNHLNPETGVYEGPFWVVDPNYRNLLKISLSQLNNCTFTVPLLKLFPDANPPNKPDPNAAKGNLLFYVFYEHDNWPTGLRFASLTWFSNPWTEMNIQYRSADVAYGTGIMTTTELSGIGGLCNGAENCTFPCSHRVNTNCAEISFKVTN